MKTKRDYNPNSFIHAYENQSVNLNILLVDQPNIYQNVLPFEIGKKKQVIFILIKIKKNWT